MNGRTKTAETLALKVSKWKWKIVSLQSSSAFLFFFARLHSYLNLASDIDKVLFANVKAGPHKGHWCYVRQGIYRPTLYRFLDVTCALNFDLPFLVQGRTHRVGGVVRARHDGTGLS